MLLAQKPQSKVIENWTDYWGEGALWPYPELFLVNAALFCKYFPQLIALNKTDKILNIGCGPGWIEKELAGQVSRIHALDTTERFVRLCEENTQELANVQVGFLGANFTDLSFLKERFSIFLCVSVVQYYESMESVKELIVSAQRLALPGAKMLIADLPRKRSKFGTYYDYACSLYQGFKEGYGILFLQKIFKEWSKIKMYQSYCHQLKHLSFTVSDLEQIIDDLNLKAEIIEPPLSFCSNRLSLLIEF